jgi:hypothetical protein
LWLGALLAPVCFHWIAFSASISRMVRWISS